MTWHHDTITKKDNTDLNYYATATAAAAVFYRKTLACWFARSLYFTPNFPADLQTMYQINEDFKINARRALFYYYYYYTSTRFVYWNKPAGEIFDQIKHCYNFYVCVCFLQQ